MEAKTLLLTIVLMVVGGAIGIGGAYLFLGEGATGYTALPFSSINVIFIMAILFITSIAILKFVK